MSDQDPFAAARRDRSRARAEVDHGSTIPMVLDHAEVKRVLREWQTFSSDDPQHITVRPETEVRDVRQLPIETDPPQHTAYRKLVEPFFRRPLDKEYQRGMQEMIDASLLAHVDAGEVEVVREFALPVQSKSLARMLGVGDDEAELWMNWGVHVFYDGDSVSKGAALTRYIRHRFAAAGTDRHDFFSTLNRAEIDGRSLTMAEKEGFASVTFAGGRDTVIGSIVSTVAHLAEDAERFEWLRRDTSRLSMAVEEIVRHLSPVSALARRCPRGGTVGGEAVEPGGRVAVSYAAANYDERVFTCPANLQLDRSPNPHLAFGFGKHHCLGAAQARLVLRCLLLSLCTHVATIEVIDRDAQVDRQNCHTRVPGFNRLVVRFSRST